MLLADEELKIDIPAEKPIIEEDNLPTFKRETNSPEFNSEENRFRTTVIKEAFVEESVESNRSATVEEIEAALTDILTRKQRENLEMIFQFYAN